MMSTTAASQHDTRPKPDGSLPVIMHVLHGMSVGGAEVLVDRMVRNLSDEFRFVVACLDEVGSLGESLQNDQFDVVHLHRSPGLDWKCVRSLREAIRKYAVDVLHPHQYTPFFYCLSARGVRQVPPVLFTEHGRHFPDSRRWKRVVFNRLMTSRRDRIVGVGNAVKEALIDNEGFARSRVDVIYNGVRPLPIQQAPVERPEMRREFKIPDDGKVVIQVARLDYLKDHGMAAQAISQLVKKHDDVYWLVVGDGPEKPELERTIKSLGIEDRVRLAGERSDVPRLLRASDLMLLSSISEGIPLTLIEGMLAGLPVVSTDVGGVSEIVRNELDGLLSPPGDVAALSQNLRSLLTEPSKRIAMAEAAIARASKDFTEATMHSCYADTYQKLLATV